MKRFNPFGIEGLSAKRPPGRNCTLSIEMQNVLIHKLLTPPKKNVVRYRLIDIQSFLKEAFEISLSISGVQNMLKNLGFSWKSGRQQHPKSSEQIQADFKKNLAIR